MLRNTVHRSICLLLLTASVASADRTVASGLTATPRATITGGEQLDAVGPRQPTKKEAAIIVVSLTLCERGDGAKCYEAAENIERLQLRLGKLHMPKALRARGRLMFQHQCDDGDANACLRFGEILFEDHDTDAALDMMGHACRLRSGGACLDMGDAYRNGQLVRKDWKKALGFYERACEAGDGRGCREAAETMVASSSTDRDRIEKLHRKACQQEDGVACAKNGQERLSRGDRTGALMAFNKACELKQLASCDDAGLLSDPGHARILFLRACDADVASACHHLADLLATSKGGDRNWGQAVAVAEKGCELDHTEKCAHAKRLRGAPPSGRCSGEIECESLCKEGIGKACRLYAKELLDPTPAFELGCNAGDQESCKRLENSRRREEDRLASNNNL